jgi:hypothetical protein
MMHTKKEMRPGPRIHSVPKQKNDEEDYLLNDQASLYCGAHFR